MAKKESGRFSLALKPYTLWGIKRLAEYENISANQFISNALDAIVEKYSDQLQEVWIADEKAKTAVRNFVDDTDAD